MDKTLNGFMAAVIVCVGMLAGYTNYRVDTVNERILLDHAKHEEYSKRLDTLEGKKPTGKTGSVGSMGSLPQ